MNMNKLILTIDDLVVRDGLYYKKFTDTPFSGDITGDITGGNVCTYKNGMKDGYWIEYWDSQELNYKGNFKNGQKDGYWINYYVNGNEWEKGNYKDGKKEGSILLSE